MAISLRHLRLAAALPLLLALPARGDGLYYAAPWPEAGWKVSASRLECRMVQQIPGYGSAAFHRKAGQDLAFSIAVQRHAGRETVARLESVPPVWIHTALRRGLGEVALVRGGVPLVMEGDRARRLLAELEQGMWPTLSYRDGADPRGEVVVAVSAINLRPALAPFLACLQGLLPADFREVSRNVVDFGLASASLEPRDRSRLARLAEYVRADETVKGVVIQGHSYRRLAAPPGLGEKRTAAISAFLVQQGIAAERIRVTHRQVDPPKGGDGYPLFRRVEVTLTR